MKNDTIKHHIEKKEFEIVKIELKKIYPEKTEAWISAETTQLDQQVNSSNTEKEFVSIMSAFTNADYSLASWMCIALSVFCQYTGVNFVLIYATVLI